MSGGHQEGGSDAVTDDIRDNDGQSPPSGGGQFEGSVEKPR